MDFGLRKISGPVNHIFDKLKSGIRGGGNGLRQYLRVDLVGHLSVLSLCGGGHNY